MSGKTVVLLILIFAPLALRAQRNSPVIVDSISSSPLSNASVFNRKGHLIGTCSPQGKLPFFSHQEYPLTIRYMGYKSATVSASAPDTIRMSEKAHLLPEVLVRPDKKEVLRLTGYMREYSTLSSYTDTVTLFREKIVDFMIPSPKAKHYKGWLSPRPLAVKSYYRFTNSTGQDSVSDYFSRHFSWADWVGLADDIKVPLAISTQESGQDKIPGRYGTAAHWLKSADNLYVDVDVLADTLNYCWVPNIATYMRDNVVFDKFNIRYKFSDPDTDYLHASDLENLSFTIETKGRGRNIFQVFKKDEPYYVNTYTELYITDREYLTTSQARKLEKQNIKDENLTVKAPEEAPELQPSIKHLIARVDNIDHIKRRIAIKPDSRLAGIDDLFKTRRSTWQQFWEIISPPRYQINTNLYPK